MKRTPNLGLGIEAAQRVWRELQLSSPTDAPIEVLAHMRGVFVRPDPVEGAQANLVRLGSRAIIGVAKGLNRGQRRFAIAHELGHFEAHREVNYLGLCSNNDLLADYRSSGREPEANAFAAEFLMPQHLYMDRCDVAAVRWEPIEALADEFQVSLTAAAVRFLQYTPDRVALVYSAGGQVQWCQRTADFGFWIPKGKQVGSSSLAYDFFATGQLPNRPESVDAEAWVETTKDLEIVEHSRGMPGYGGVLTLLWFPAT